jgi:hypothetical protein
MCQGRAEAEDPQPWRCVVCNEAVSHIRRNPCACIRAALEPVVKKPEGK